MNADEMKRAAWEEDEAGREYEQSLVDREREMSESEWWHSPALPYERVQDA
jgi:hypothetical protein